jgi:hypothetical protein
MRKVLAEAHTYLEAKVGKLPCLLGSFQPKKSPPERALS